VHKVNIIKPFYIGVFPVTQGEWKTVMGTNPSYLIGDNLPVESVSWNDCQNFISKLNIIEGKKIYRLPTEAEWEYACRAGSQSKYFFGDDESLLHEFAWFDENSDDKTHSVWERNQTNGAYMICMGTYGNGAKMVIKKVIVIMNHI